MARNRTADIIRSSFGRSASEGGFTSGRFCIDSHKKQEERKRIKDSAREKIQAHIKKLVIAQTPAEEIKKQLEQTEEYQHLSQYFEQWIEHWIINTNLDVKNKLKRLMGVNSDEKAITEDIRNNPIYEIYKNEIENSIKIALEAKNKKIIEKMQQQEQEEER